MDFQQGNTLDLNEIDGVWSFLQSIDWYDPWLIGLIVFHILVTATTLMTRNHGNIQVLLFSVMLLLVYFSESINEIAASNWRMFSRQQYFDSKGMFISIVFSVPILLNCMIMVANWLWQSSELMTRLKVAQLKQMQRRANEDNQEKNKKKS